MGIVPTLPDEPGDYGAAEKSLDMNDADSEPIVPRWAAAIAGAGLLAMAIAAPVAAFGLLPKGELHGAALVFVVVAALDAVVGWTLHVCFGAHARRLSIAAATLRIVYAAMLAASVRHLFAGQAAAFQHEWDAALGVFGVHLAALGVLLVRRSGAARWVGLLVIVSGAGYLVDALGTLVVGRAPGAAKVTFLGELVLMGWLLGIAIRRRRMAPISP